VHDNNKKRVDEDKGRGYEVYDELHEENLVTNSTKMSNE